MSHLPVYFDNAATTAVDPRVVDAMLPTFGDIYGNAASRSHRFGWDAAAAVDDARAKIATLIGADAGEIVFTSGATESNNLALKGVMAGFAGRRDHLVTVATEHPSVLESAERLEGAGYRVTVLGVNPDGRIDLNRLAECLSDRTALVSVMWANNETGILQDIAAIGTICHERHVLFHSDATQAAGKAPIDFVARDVDLMSLSAHKLYGPKGIGALYVRRGIGVRIEAQMDGGGHEQGLRAGTLNVPGAVGFGAAAKIAFDEMPVEIVRIAGLRDALVGGLQAACPAVRLNCITAPRVPGIASVKFPGMDAGRMASALNERAIAVSTGSACSSTKLEPSTVLIALGLSESDARSTVRFSLGRFNTQAEVKLVVNVVAEIVAGFDCEMKSSDAGAIWETKQTRSGRQSH